ncbi:hypothetical protein SDC9_91936 [bioreactor metagenome]|uniref:Uncharacterized protein n=1 Tax=bioreactor metagenome TaxID=1076179 RepID=A0A644ZW97_9ZZZZ
MPHPVEVIALPTELFFPLIEQRILGIGKVRAVHQQQSMQKSHHIDEGAEPELPISHNQQENEQERRRHLTHPSQPIQWTNSRNNVRYNEKHQKDYVQGFRLFAISRHPFHPLLFK